MIKVFYVDFVYNIINAVERKIKEMQLSGIVMVCGYFFILVSYFGNVFCRNSLQ